MNIENKTENATDSFNYSEYMLITQIGDKIVFYLSILTILIGIPGNIISILIFIKPCLNNKTNTGFLYTFLCVINLITILFNVFVQNSYLIFHYLIKLHLYSDIFIQTILLQILTCSQVLITFDRFIAVVFPIKGVRIMSKRWVLYTMILGMFVVIIGLNSPYFIREARRRFIDYDDETFSDLSVYIQVIKISLKVFIPNLTIIILDVIVVIRMRKSKCLSEGQNTNASNKSSRFARNTILMDLIYLIFNLPSAIYDIFFILVIPNIRVQTVTLTNVYLSLIFEALFEIFAYFYSSFIFILFIVFNKIFRAEFTALISHQRFFIFLKNLFV